MAFNIVAGVNNALYGSVSGSGSYEEGAEVTLTVSPEDGYRFVSWDDSNTDNPRVFNASEDLTLIATLEAIPEYAVALTVNNNNFGTVSGSGNYVEGSTATISATPALHCRFVKWDDDNTDNPRSITVNSAITLEAIFETVNWYSISTSVNDATMGSVTGAGDYDEGDTVTLTATANTDYKFVMWQDESTDNPRTFTASASGSYEAVFAEIVYADVTIASNDNEWGTVSGATSGSMEVGTELTLTATPETDYKFDGWQVDGEVVSTSSTLNLTVIDDVDIIAVFSAIVFYQLNLISSDTECGTISITSASETARGDANNIYPEGTVITVVATPTVTGKFLNWSDGSLELTRTIYLTENTTLRANFYPASGLILVTKKILQQTWSTIKSFFSASTGASKIGAPANNVLGATTLADVVNSAGQPGGIAILNNSGKVAAADIDGTLSNDTTGNAATASVADKIGSSTVGSSTEPVYINAGVPTACGSSLAVDITGNAATATTAAACSGNAATATNATNVLQEYGTANVNRPILLSNLQNITTTSNQTTSSVFSNKFYANPSTGVQTATGGFSSSGSYTTSLTTSTHLAGNKGTAIINSTAAKGYTMLARMKSTNGVFCHGVYNGDYQFYYTADSVISANTNSVTKTCLTINENGTVSAPNGFSGALTGNVTGDCSGSSGSCTGNAASATKAKVTHTGAEWRDILGVATGFTSASNQDIYGANSGAISFYVDANATSGDQRGILRLGNNIANTTAAGHNGQIWMYGTSTGFTNIVPGYNSTSNITLTLPSSTGTIALTSSNITGSSASCTGNAATATTATNANNAKLTHTVGNSEYPLVFGSSFVINDSQQALRIGTPSTTAANCALRCKAYCAAANTQGEAYLVCGNNLAKASANNARGSIYLYGTSTAHTQIVPGNNSTSNVVITLPASTGTLALTSSNITGSSASCTGNAATATTASACSGNAASSTYATNIRVTQSSVSSWYNLVYTSGIAANTNYSPLVNTNSALRFHGTANPSSASSSTKTYAYLAVGNNTACSNVAGRIGVLRLYGQSTGYTDVVPGYASTSSVTVTLPAKTGTVALTSDIPTTDYIVEEGHSTTNSYGADDYYRKWNNGIMEIWGSDSAPSTATGDTIRTETFLKAFLTNTLPQVYITGTYTAELESRMAYFGYLRSGNTTNTSFKIYLNPNYKCTTNVHWYAVGRYK